MSSWFSKRSNDEPSEQYTQEEISLIKLVREKGGLRQSSLFLLGLTEGDLETIKEHRELTPPSHLGNLKAFLLYAITTKYVDDSKWDDARAIKGIRKLANAGLTDPKDLATLVQLAFVLFKRRFRNKKSVA